MPVRPLQLGISRGCSLRREIGELPAALGRAPGREPAADAGCGADPVGMPRWCGKPPRDSGQRPGPRL